ncbi:MAG: hypothetical protein IT365_06450, partial [Candidatus Hydrogenedentes bacterium]|nr:hypothetical protein [Candidatus Hydrogenedentota bacterium]
MGLIEDFDKAICDEVPGIVDAVSVYSALDDEDDRRAAMMRVAREAIATSYLVQR